MTLWMTWINGTYVLWNVVWYNVAFAVGEGVSDSSDSCIAYYRRTRGLYNDFIRSLPSTFNSSYEGRVESVPFGETLGIYTTPFVLYILLSLILCNERLLYLWTGQCATESFPPCYVPLSSSLTYPTLNIYLFMPHVWISLIQRCWNTRNVPQILWKRCTSRQILVWSLQFPW